MSTPDTYPNGEGGKVVNNNPQPDTFYTIGGYVISNVIPPTFAPDLPADYAYMIGDCLNLWASKLMRNQLKYRYYNGKNTLKDLQISIPPMLRDVETVVGWPQKAVDTMAVRSRFDGFTATDADTQAILDDIAQRSRLRIKYRQAVQSALIHSCCFATVTVDEDGEPLIDLYSAENAAARWDFSKGRIAYGIVIHEFNDGQPVLITLHASDAVIHARLTASGYWEWTGEAISMGRPTMESLAYRPTYRRPFGQSRITRAVMSITDSAVREALRTEISAEFFTSPQKYLLGADPDAFANKPMWEAYIGNIFAVGRDENGQTPQFGQLSQGSMQPHTDYMRALAARLSGETNIPISTLGIVHDQPASAEAIYAASEPLIIECEDFNENARDMLKGLALMAIAAKVDKPISELSDAQTDFTANFRNPAMPSVVSQTDAMIKIASVVPGFAGTDVFFEQIGFSEDMRRKTKSEIRRNGASFTLANLLNGEQRATSTATAPAEQGGGNSAI